MIAPAAYEPGTGYRPAAVLSLRGFAIFLAPALAILALMAASENYFRSILPVFAIIGGLGIYNSARILVDPRLQGKIRAMSDRSLRRIRIDAVIALVIWTASATAYIIIFLSE